jgi:FlaA1/EpsC-like NDP-sugar epimerase
LKRFYEFVIKVSGETGAWLVGLPRYAKRTVLVVFDFCALAVVAWAAVSLRYGTFTPITTTNFALLLIAAPVITTATFAYMGLYRLVTRYIGERGQAEIVLAVWTSVMMWALVVFMGGQHGMPRSAIFLYGIGAMLVVVGSRQFMGWLLKSAGVRIPKDAGRKGRKPVLIYGAGHAGIQLREALARGSDCKVVGFIDSSPSLWGQYIGDVRVYRPGKLMRLLEREEVEEVLLALPESRRQERRAILQELEPLHVQARILPAIEDIASGRITVDHLRPVDVGDLLGRDPVPSDPDLLSRAVRGKIVMVTGAGGSVGSELVRQIIKLEPRSLVLFDNSESALYEIHLEASELIAAKPLGRPRPRVVAILGSVLDARLVRDTISELGVQTIYHAAAYKHVPIVERNPFVGLNNNTFGVVVVAEAAEAAGVERMVLVSTDKSVRPTNIMGASKRLGEIFLQAKAAAGSQTIFTMVRFGNVLDSSGSVVPLFRRQIRAGGPVTVTHPEVTRYFMSIPEAAELVIQAGAMAKGGDVFVLDMGSPVKINDLARLMIHLSGLEVRDAANPQGDIAIEYVGLRPGDKLFEELLIGRNTTATEHPRILRSEEPLIPPAELKREFEILRMVMAARDTTALNQLLLRVVEGYTPDQASVDAAREAWGASRQTLH